MESKKSFTGKKTSEDKVFEKIHIAKNNQAINKVLWGCCITGPLVAVGLFFGIFVNVTYTACIYITVFEIAMALIHFILYRKYPTSKITAYFCLFAMEWFLFFMAYMNIGIHLTYFIIPLLSLFYCDRNIYVNTSLVNFFIMIFSLFYISPMQAAERTDFASASQWFWARGMGFVIEYLVMFFSGYALGGTINRYYENLYEDKIAIRNEKDRANSFVKLAQIDELTGLLNRRAYEESIKEVEVTKNLIAVVVDINGLKNMNDVFGHDSGDEMIIGTADCIKKAFSEYGKIFRIGGDEFVCLLDIPENELTRVKENFVRIESQWTGEKVKQLSMAIGYAPAVEYQGLTAYELVRVADKKMYAEKEEFYRITGMERRKY